MITDPIADILTRIRNAMAVRKSTVSLPYSKLKHRIADILVTEGRIQAAAADHATGLPTLVITLKYVNNQPAIQHLKRVSTPGRRVYVDCGHLPYVYDGLGFAIVSTSRGLMTNKQARKQRVGGEVLCEIF